MHEAKLLGISADAWIQAFAGFLGVIVTIAATLWIERRRREARARTAMRALRDALARIDELNSQLVRGLDPKIYGSDHVSNLVAFQQEFLRRLAKYGFVRSRLEISDPDLWEALTRYDEAIASWHATLHGELEATLDDGESAQVSARAVSRFEQAAHDFAREGGDARRLSARLSTP